MQVGFSGCLTTLLYESSMMTTPASAIRDEVSKLIDVQIETLMQP
jgi:hypothetical protein